MKKGVILSAGAARRTRDAVRIVEGLPTRALSAHTPRRGPRVYLDQFRVRRVTMRGGTLTYGVTICGGVWQHLRFDPRGVFTTDPILAIDDSASDLVFGNEPGLPGEPNVIDSDCNLWLCLDRTGELEEDAACTLTGYIFDDEDSAETLPDFSGTKKWIKLARVEVDSAGISQIIQYHTGPVETVSFTQDQFTVVQDDSTHVKVYCGYWHRIQITAVDDSSASLPEFYYPKTRSTKATDGGDVKFGTVVGGTGGSVEITETCKLWLKLDWSGGSDVLSGEIHVDDPDMEDEHVYWLPFAQISVAGGVITYIEQLHSGSIVTTDYGHPEECD